MLGLLGGALLAWHPSLAQPNAASALLLGLLLPPRVGSVAARQAAHDGVWQGVAAGGAALLRALGAAWGLLALIAFLSDRPFCDPERGLLLWGLGPLTGGLLASAIGAALGEVAGVAGAARAAVMAALLPWLDVGRGLLRFYTSPAVALFGHFAGWFPGTPYDERLPVPAVYFTFRLLTAAWGLGALAVGSAWARRRAGWWPWKRAVLACVLLLGAGWGESRAPRWGHAVSRASLEEALGQRLQGRRCVLYAPHAMSRSRLLRRLQDCDFRVEQMASRLGVAPPTRIHLFWFASADQKQRLIGAGRTHVAKPWRLEAHVQEAPWPHPVLAHEVAHLVAASVGRGPWRVAGRWGGWLPEPVLIEGLAVALAWQPIEGATPHQWARALLERGELPSVRSLQGPGFMLRTPPHAYTAAGSLLRFMLARLGAESVRRLYREGRLDGLVDMDVLEASWHAFLRSVPLEGRLRERVADRFAPRGLLALRCAAPLAEARAQALQALSAGAWEACERALQRWERLAPGDALLQVSRIERLAGAGAIDRARVRLAELRRRGLARAFVARAQLAVARGLWRRGRRAEASEHFAQLLEAPLSPGTLRAVEVSRLALAEGGEMERLLRGWFAAGAGEGLGAAEAMRRAVRLGGLRPDGLGPYLEAGLLLREERFEEAAGRLEEALRRGLPTARLGREALRRQALAWSGAGAWTRAEPVWRALRGADDGTGAEAEDFLERIERERGR